MKRRKVKIITLAVTACLVLSPVSATGAQIGRDIGEGEIEEYEEISGGREETEEVLLEPEETDVIHVEPEETEDIQVGPDDSDEIHVEPEEPEVILIDPDEPDRDIAQPGVPENMTDGDTQSAGDDLDADNASVSGCELYIAGFCKKTDNANNKVYFSVTSSSGTATVYTGAYSEYYEIVSENTDVKTWSVSDTSILKVAKEANNSARLTPLKAGTATITATSSSGYGGVKGTCKVTVKQGTGPKSVAPGQSSVTINKGQSKSISFTWDPSDCTYKEIYLKTTSGSDCISRTYDSATKVTYTGKKGGTAKVDYYDGFTNTKRGTITLNIVVPVTGVSVSPASATLTPGATKQLTATISPSDATNQSVTWTSSATGVATVSSSGLVTGKSPGTATITAKSADGAGTASCTVTVNKVAVAAVTLSSTAEAVINVGGTVSRSVTVTPTNATYPTVTWESANTSVATVSGGTVTGRGPGSTTITAKADGRSASFKVTVRSPVSSVTLNKTSMSMVIGDTQTIVATVLPADASNKSVTWSSSYPSIASVNSNGTVTALSPGRTSISAVSVDGAKKAVCEVTVLPVSVTGVSVSKDKASVMIGYTLGLSATVYPDNATDKSIRWSTSVPDVASVSSGGLVKGLKLGSADITVTTTDGNRTAVCAVTVVPVPASSVLLNKDEANLVTGQSKVLTATVLPEDTTDKSVTWKSSDESVATVDAYGRVTGVSVGFAVITATTNSEKRIATCAVIVTDTETDQTMKYSENEDGSVTVTGSEGTTCGDLVIPGTFKGRRVSGIGRGAFAGFSGITGKLVIPADITDLGEGAFDGMYNVSVVENNSGQPIPASYFISPSEKDKVCFADKDGNMIYYGGMLGKGPYRRYYFAIQVTPEPKPLPTGTPTPEPTKSPVAEPTKAPITPAPVKKIEAQSIKLNKKKVTVVKGKTVKLAATISPADTTDRTVKWKSSNKKVATVDKNGRVKGKKKGTATISATTSNGRTFKCKVTVKNPVRVKSIKLNKKKATVKVGKTTKLKITFNPKKPTNKKVTWKSSNKKVATVDKNGKVKGIKKGKVTITATSKDGGKKAKCTVTVK